MSLQYSEFKTDIYIQDLTEYYKTRTKKPRANSIEECNHYFRTSDSFLRKTLFGLIKLIDANTVPGFGIPKPNVKLTPSGILQKRCCDCINDPVPYEKKNRARAQAEAYAEIWLNTAQKWIANGMKPMEIGPRKIKKKIKHKNPFE